MMQYLETAPLHMRPTRVARALTFSPGALLAVVGVLVGLAVLLQWLAGAYRAEFGGNPDEAAHFVTGLMIRDYVAHGFVGSPMAFAREFYEHYPKVALGNWPPFFYLLQGAWTLVFPVSTASLMALMAVVTGVYATTVFAIGRRSLGAPWALGAAAFFLSLPLVQEHASMAMTENLVGALELLSLLAFTRYLDAATWPRAAVFGLLASAAVLTKGSGLALALAAPITLLLTRQFRVLRERSFWGSVVLIVVLCAPWMVLTLDVAKRGWARSEPSWGFFALAIPANAAALVTEAGPLTVALALLGLIVTAVGHRHVRDNRWAALTALLVAVPVFHALVPAGIEARHMVPALPAVVLLATAGIAASLRWLARAGVNQRLAGAVVIAVVLGAYAGQTFTVYHKGFRGFDAVVQRLLAESAGAHRAFLVSSDASGEGAFIGQVAMREERPGHYARRASKYLAVMGWNGPPDYEPKFRTESEMVAFMRQDGLEFVVVDTTIPAFLRLPHHSMLERAVAARPEEFPSLGVFPMERGGVRYAEGLRVYAVRPPLP
jgi:hypothetical protein